MSEEIVKDDQNDQASAEAPENEAAEQETVVTDQEAEQTTETSDDAVDSGDTTEETGTDESGKKFSQSEMDSLVKERLGRQEKKLKREFERSAELQVNSSIPVDNSIIYDPDTGLPLDSNDDRYKSIKAQRDTQQAIEYNNQILSQQTQMEKAQREEQKLVMEVESSFEDQLTDLQSSDVDGFERLQKEELLKKPQCFGMVQAIADHPNGVQILADLIKNDYTEAKRISNQPYSKQLLEMAKLVHIKSKGAGDPIVKSNAPPPVESFGSGVGNAVNKSADEMSFDELYKATRERNKFLC